MVKPFADEMFTQDVFALPARDGGDPGGQLERTMADRAGGYAGIVRVEEVDVDGTVTGLYTRGGFPVFETDQRPLAAAPTGANRGFVARSSTSGRAVLFNPYTLSVLNPNYAPAKNTYAVQEFATTWNVPPSDISHWYDVILFDGAKIKVNAKTMSLIGIQSNQTFAAIPYCIDYSRDEPYGTEVVNQTEKRVFAVGRSDVQSWGGSGAIVTLTPSAPRTEDRSLTIGPRVSASSDKAWLGQIYHAASGWDGIGEWSFSAVEVGMLLAAPYLTGVNSAASVAMSPATLTNNNVPTSGSTTEDVMLPDGAELCLYGTAVHHVNTPYSKPANGIGGSFGYQVVAFPWAGIITRALRGQIVTEYQGRLVYSGSASATSTQAGIILRYSQVNQKLWDDRYSETRQKDGTEIFGLPTETPRSQMSVNANGELMWGNTQYDFFDPAQVPPYRGRGTKYIYNYAVQNTRISDVNHQEQTASFSVQIENGEYLVNGSLMSARATSQSATILPATGYYDTFLADPWGFVNNPPSSGMGLHATSGFSAYVSPFSDLFPIYTYYKNPTQHDQDPSATNDINAKYGEAVSATMQQTHYDSEENAGYGDRGYYYGQLSATGVTNTRTLSWATKDYLLYDADNHVYIFIDGQFSGNNTVATLTVTLTVKTRHHINTQQLWQTTYTYSELLPEVEVIPGKYAVPSPQIRAIFAPLYQEQGSFKGAHYVTQAEENKGAAAFHGFSFVLYLRTYDSVGHLNADNEAGQNVLFVPCNLLEMLYAIVFSQQYGVGPTRYPVIFTQRYNDIMNTLFSNPTRVSVRDGVASPWTGAFGSDFTQSAPITLHRT